MKVLMITISKGLIARNLLQNDFYELVKKHFDRVVILTTASADKRFLDEFKADNVFFIPLVPIKDTFLGKLIGNISRYIIYNGRTEMMGAYNFDRDKNTPFLFWYPKYLLLKLIFNPLSKIKILRKILQKFDYLFLNRNEVEEYKELIKKYNPSVVLVTNIIDDTEAVLLKAAQKEKIPTIAMVKSWDNLSKRYFGARADNFAVWNEFMKKQAINLQDYTKDQITIIGVPQFDYYIDKSRLLGHEEFCRRVGLDPQKKIIFFGSEGKLMPTDPNIVKVIEDFIINRELVRDCQVFVRPHFAYTNDREKFKDFFESNNIIVDKTHNFSSSFSDKWDYSREQIDHFLNCIYHSEMIINTASTLTADAMALDKPVILIKFEGYEKKSKYESVAGWYTSDYYKEVVSFKAASEADSVSILKECINQYLEDRDILCAQREKFKQYFCYKVDGKSGKRLFDVLARQTRL